VRAGSLVFEWTSPSGGEASNWVVVRQSGRRTRTVIGELTPDGELVQHKTAPFSSVILEEARRESSARLRKWSLAGLRAVVISVLVVIATSLMFGLAQVKVVASESMTGTFSKGDLVLIVSTAIEEPAVGKIAAFNYYNLDRTEIVGLFSHRIIDGNAESGWKTKGDANADADVSPVLRSDIVGIVVGWIPAVGFLVQPQVLFGIGALVVISFVLGPELRGFVKERRR